MHTRALWLLVVFLIVALAARLYQIQAQSIWFDEGWSADAAGQPTLQAAVAADPTNPPLYYLLLNLSSRVFGDSLFALRWVSVLFGLLAIPLTYQLAWRLFDTRAGVYAAFLVAFSPLLWWASQEARMYSLLAALLLAAAIGWYQLLGRPARWAWLAVWGGELGLLYAHNTGPVVALWLNVVTVIAWGFQLSNSHSRPVVSLRPDWRLWIAGQIGVALLWSPWFVTRFVLLQAANSAVNSPPEIGLALLSRMWQALWAGPWLMVEREPIIVVSSAILFVLALGVIPWRNMAARWLVLHVAILTATLLAGLWMIGNEIHGRYLVMVAPLLLVAIGAGLARLPLAAHRMFAVGLVFVTFVVSVYYATHNPAYGHDDARGMVQYYADHLTAQDTVLAWSYADRYELAYYWNRLGVQARRVTLPEGGDLESVLPLLPNSGDVALNVWYTQRADYRGMMACVLGHGTTNPPEEFTVYGMSNLLYRSPELNLPARRSMDAGFAPFGDSAAVQLDAVGEFPTFEAAQAMCLPVQIILTSAINTDLKAAVVVYNDLGWEVARADAVFATANQRTSSQATADDILTAYPLVRLPYGAPPGDYMVRLRIYDKGENLSGYNVLPADGISAGKDLLLGTWRVLPGSDWTRVNHSADLPVTINLPVNENLTLLAHNAVPGTLVNGSDLRLSFLWDGTGSLPDIALVAIDGSWRVDVPGSAAPNGVTLDWRMLRVPPDVEAGEAQLWLDDGEVLAHYEIEVLPAQFTEPEYGVAVDVVFPGVGTLVGYTLSGDTFDRSQPVSVTLVWQAESAADISYTVFVQLLGEDGNVIAQSDAVPAQGNRPMTGWRPDEYIVDLHQVTFHQDATAGSATLIVGMYDAATGDRITLPDGSTAITLAEGLLVR